MELADKKTCIGCGACAYVCPKQCISFKDDGAYGISYPTIDDDRCINCGKCNLSCPALHTLKSSEPLQAYAAWSTDAEERRTSASGGIAAEIYKYAIENGWSIVGAAFHERFEVKLKLTDSAEAIKEFKNSKYVFSSATDIYGAIAEKLKAGHKIAIIALPCQIATIKKVFHKNIDNLLLVDLVCHGTTPPKYLEQYIRHIESVCGKKAHAISFRDPEMGTQKFALSFWDKDNNRFYADYAVGTADIYQYGYHQAVTYRENCYHCPYANRRRISDMTLSDYKGLGSMAPCSFTEEKVNCVLANSEKGKNVLENLLKAGRIFAEARPLDEPIKGDKQLRHPSLKTYARFLFENEYAKREDFASTMQKVYRRTRLREMICWAYHLPRRIIGKIRRTCQSLFNHNR